MKKILAIMSIFAAVTVTAVHADPGPYDAFLTADGCDTTPDGVATPCMNVANTNVVDVVNYLLTNASVASPFATNTDLDAIQLTTSHSYWGNAAAPGTLAYIYISADGLNTPGIYEQGNVANQVYMSGSHTGDTFFGDGSIGNPYPGLENLFISNSFGIFLEHIGDQNFTKYSDPALNEDGLDHMMAFDLHSYLDGQSIWVDLDNDGIADQEVILSNTYLLAFEDVNLVDSDHDYNDSVFLFSNVTAVPTGAVPEPMTMALFGTGLIGMAIRGKKIGKAVKGSLVKN